MNTLVQYWLAMQCQLIGRVAHGMVLMGPVGRGPFVPVASWPEGGTGGTNSELAAAAESALAQRQAIVQAAAAEARQVFAYPLLFDDKLAGVIAVESPAPTVAQQKGVMQTLQWGAVWLEVLVRQQSVGVNERLISVVELVATSLEQERFQAAAMAVVTDLAGRMRCERVSMGFVGARRTRVRAVSHSAQFGDKTNLIRNIGRAMDEALDQEAVIVYPAPADAAPHVTTAHAELARRHAGKHVCSIPLTHAGEMLGCLTLERAEDRAFERKTLELCEHAASLLGPILDIRRREDRSLLRKATEACRGQVTRLIGPGHARLKVGGAMLAAALAFLAVAEGDYRVSARASLEPGVQRAVVAPMEGFIATAHARAGDIVGHGDVLAALEDKDLKLERLKWSSQGAQLRNEYRGAMASHDRAQVKILGAQIEQAAAQMALIDEQLARTQLTAPFAGIVVSGDLTQSLGSPVERGQVLFEVAPLDAYRIMLRVDERDVGDVATGQHGHLALSGSPDDVLPFVVSRVTPVSTTEEGHNYFRVEAQLQDTSDRLRPGMAGIGKIDIARRKLAWIWTHTLTDWLRLQLWTWWSA